MEHPKLETGIVFATLGGNRPDIAKAFPQPAGRAFIMNFLSNA